MRHSTLASLNVATLAFGLLAAASSFAQTPAPANSVAPQPTASVAAKNEPKAGEVRVPPFEIPVPTLELTSITKATVGHWFKKAGDAVAMDEPLVELETDQTTIEVPAPLDGTLSKIIAKEGETVTVGALLGQISAGGRGKAAVDKPPR